MSNPIVKGQPSADFFVSSKTSAAEMSQRGEKCEDEDELLVRSAKGGDTCAFDQLVVKYGPKLYGLVYHMTSSHEDTNDLLQEIFAKTYRSLRKFRGRSKFYTWVYSISVNMTLNFLKKRNRYWKISLDDVDRAIEFDDEFVERTSKADIIRECNIHDLQRRLNEALMQLTDDHRAVVIMFDIQGMPHADIAKILKISPGTVRSRLYYAHRQLQNCLEEFRT